MMTVRPGSHMYALLRLLSVSGEFPSKSLGILGDVRTIKAMVHKMEAVQNIRLLSDNSNLTSKVFQVSGKGNMRTVRLCKSALRLLCELHPDALENYLAAFRNHHFPGNSYHVLRNHRVGESAAMCMAAGVEIAPYKLPELQKEDIRVVRLRSPGYYVARNIKKLYTAELNKTMFTRVAGLLLYPGGSYAVYNTRDAVMKWSGMGELKARQELSEIVRMNAALDEVTSALLMGVDETVALQTLVESDKSRRKQVRFDRIYHSIHFIPMNADGVSLLKILTLQNWQEKLMRVLFKPEMRPRGASSIEYDACVGNTYIFSHLDSDIARLLRFNEARQSRSEDFEVLCFPWQVSFLQNYLGGAVRLKTIGMTSVLNALGFASQTT